VAAHAVAGGVIDSLRGRSGKLLARQMPRSSPRVSLFARLLGDSLVRSLGVHDVKDSTGASRFALITIRDFTDKLDGRIGGYRIGFWPSETGRSVSGAYANPAGFIEVTPENADTQISEHFRLRDFLTHDQQDVWPKYLVLREDLVDKLELVIDELQREGHVVKHMSVMSGFRTPQYNASGGETGGRAQLSRHMYGDAADVFVDNDGHGRMDDLNGDGRVDYRDAQVIVDAVERVERTHPDVTGGAGVYRATSSHGPFAHVDVRGYRARWGRQ
jgi:Peptidase M15